MKDKITRSVLLLIFAVVAGLYGGATTCISNKKFKVKRACGTVTDPTGAPIPKVDLELLDNQSVVLQRVPTDEDGRFNVPNVAKGEYVLRVNSPYFATAWQPFIVTKSSANARCSKPMEVRLDLRDDAAQSLNQDSWRNISIALFDPDGCRTILGERYRLVTTVVVITKSVGAVSI
jgi:hypothetical protein